MKKVFAFLLTLCLLLSLAACGKSDATTTAAPTTEAKVMADLVTAYESDSSASMGAFSMAFAYESDYRSGTMSMIKDDEEAPGTFTCDENYNINHMEIVLDETEGEKTLLTIDCTFDDAHRLLTAKLQLKDGEGEKLLYSAAYTYDSQGRKVYAKVSNQDKYTSISIIEYREDGQVLRQTTEFQLTGAPSQVTVIGYIYDENGCIKSMAVYDGEGNIQEEMPATHEVKEDGIHYTMEMEGSKLVLVVNEQGQITLQESYSGGELISSIKTEFDDAGRAIRLEQWVVYTNTTTVITYDYLADGRLREHKQTDNGQELIVQRTTFQTVEIPT